MYKLLLAATTAFALAGCGRALPSITAHPASFAPSAMAKAQDKALVQAIKQAVIERQTTPPSPGTENQTLTIPQLTLGATQQDGTIAFAGVGVVTQKDQPGSYKFSFNGSFDPKKTGKDAIGDFTTQFLGAGKS